MAKIGKVFDTLKKGIILWDKHGGKIQSAISHGKNAVEKGKEFFDSEDGITTLGFVKEKFFKNKSSKRDGSGCQEPNKVDESAASDLNFGTILNAMNKAKEIYDQEIKVAVADFQEKIEPAEQEEKKEDDISATEIEEVIEANDASNELVKKEDTFFEDKRDELLDAAKQCVMNLNNPEEVLNAFCKLQSVANETIKYAEEQETKRAEINARKDVAIEKIKVIETCIKDYLEKTFDERRSIFEKQFECVDAALKTGNLELLAASLNSINSLAAQSPFKALADVAAVQKKLLDTNTEWDI